MTPSPHRPHVPFTYTRRIVHRGYRPWDGKEIYAECAVEVHTSAGPMRFRWPVFVRCEQDAHAVLDRHVQDRARAMRWRPA